MTFSSLIIFLQTQVICNFEISKILLTKIPTFIDLISRKVELKYPITETDKTLTLQPDEKVVTFQQRSNARIMLSNDLVCRFYEIRRIIRLRIAKRLLVVMMMRILRPYPSTFLAFVFKLSNLTLEALWRPRLLYKKDRQVEVCTRGCT